MVNIKEINPFELELRELWNIFQEIQDDLEIPKLEIDKIKNGTLINYPIYYLFEEWYDIYPATKRVAIKGHGKHDLLTFLEDKEIRESTIRKYIVEYQNQDNIVKPRN